MSSAPRWTWWTARPAIATALLLALLLGATLAVYWGVWSFDYVSFDDPEYVAANQHVLRGVSWDAAGWAFTTGYFSYWHPLTWISHQLDATWFGTGPSGPHTTNLALHLANTALVFLVLASATRQRLASAFVAAWFALHPLHVESVAWISERKDLLSTFFVLLSIGAYVRDAANLAGRPAWRRGWYAASLAAFALALMSKPMVVTLPLALLLLDHWPLRRGATTRWRVLLAEKIPFVLLGAAVGVVTIATQAHNDAVGSLVHFSALDRVTNACVAWAKYLVKTLWPADLAFFYPHPGRWPWPDLVASLAVVIGVSLVAWRWRQRFPFGFVGWCWFLGLLLPAIGLVQVGDQAMADRYTYVPALGLFVIVAWAGVAWVEAHARRRWPVVALGLGVTLAWATVAARQVTHWRDSEALCRHALAVTSGNFVAHNNLANVLLLRGGIDEAIEHYRRALELRPDFPSPHSNLGTALLQRGEPAAALPHLQRALELQPRFAEVHHNLGTAQRQLGDLDAADVSYRQALALRPDFAAAHHSRGTLCLQRGAVDEGIAHLQQAAQLDPAEPAYVADLGFAWLESGRADDALRCFEAVLQREPRFARARFGLATALLNRGRVDEAVTQFRAVLATQPDSFETLLNLGWVLLQRGDVEGARPLLERATQLRPDHPLARHHFALAVQRSAQRDVPMTRPATAPTSQ